MKGKDFIFTGLQSWDIPIGSNAVDIAREIARDNRVLYVNGAVDMMTFLRSRNDPSGTHRVDVVRKRKSPLRRISDSLYVLDLPFITWSVNEFPDGSIFDYFNRRNNIRTFRYIKNIAAELNFRDIIHFIDNDIYRSFYSKEILNPFFSVYYRRDNLLPLGYWKHHAGRLEPMLISKSDLIVCNSPQLADFARQFNPKSYDVGQGVDLTAYDPFREIPQPPDLSAINEPRIGYIGDINSARLDADLLYNLAKSRPDYSFVMVGGEDRTFEKHALHSLKNVYFTGRIPKSRVPEYMTALNVCLNPQVLNEITNGNYPRKVDEYLAMGKPVVATRTATMELFRDHCHLCSSLDEYREAVDNAIRETDPEQIKSRILFARSHSWQNNVQQIYRYISENLPKHTKKQ